MGAREEPETSFRRWRGSSCEIGRSLARMRGDLSTQIGNQTLPGLWAIVLAYIRPLIIKIILIERDLFYILSCDTAGQIQELAKSKPIKATLLLTRQPHKSLIFLYNREDVTKCNI